MKEDVFGPLLRALLETTTEPLSAQDMREGVTHPETGENPSIQRVYMWIKNNRQNMCQMGQTTRGGSTYVWRTNPMVARGRNTEARSGAGSGSSAGGVLEVGIQLTITRLWIEDGVSHMELTDAEGKSYTVQV